MRQIFMGCVLWAQLASAETVLSPRSKAERDADMKMLQEKYGPKQDQQLQSQIGAQASPQATPTPAVKAGQPSYEERVAARTAESAVAASAGVTGAAAGSKIRIDLAARPGNKFAFDGQDYVRKDLEPVLLSKKYKVDHIVLTDGGLGAISLALQLDLSALSTAIKAPALIQQGDQMRPVPRAH
jgi:hypothetical protein